ncbi:single-stranded DNA-binding protein [Bifidobacterium sp. 64T4]|uniref:single-stranded DNA-binding protein n=1 Tax=Bifidobacterium pongonis TaxID=2834432 RepID=UPI001C5A1F3C|nr:single-stranded DNA-binding protein [Bifidobacterium pongonis]MBW3095364.1 single-stranded DNA-binding protein [Bifidobacterium pongonis]
MAGETVITIIGNLTADPELRTTSTGASVCGFTIASTPRTWNRQSGQYEDGQPLFLRCSAWRELANHCASSLAKGMRVIAQGRLQQRSYQAQDGTNRTVYEMQVDEIGPSLRYATAQVSRTSHTRGQAGNTGNGYAGGATGFAPAAPTPGSPEDPWASSGPAFGAPGTQAEEEPEF